MFRRACLGKDVRAAKIEYRNLSVELYRRARHQRLAQLQTNAVDRIARVKIIAAIQHYIRLHYQIAQLRFVGAHRQRNAFDFRIDVVQRGSCRTDLGLTDRRGAMNDLALQIAEIHRVMVTQGQLPDTAGGQIQRGGRTEPAEADDQHLRRKQALLPLDADLRQQDVAAVAQQLLVVHVYFRQPPM